MSLKYPSHRTQAGSKPISTARTINRNYTPPPPAEDDDDQGDEAPTPKQQTRMPKTRTKPHEEDD